jgi:hypothetical protein
MLCSSTPADRMRQAFATHPMLPSLRLTRSAPRSVTFRGSITRPVRSLSTLRSSDYSDDTTQDSLPADATPGGAGLEPAGCNRRFHSAMSLHITLILPRQALPGAPTAVTPRRWRSPRWSGWRAEAGPRQPHAKVSRRWGAKNRLRHKPATIPSHVFWGNYILPVVDLMRCAAVYETDGVR